MTRTTIVVSASIGTAVLFLFAIAVLSVAIVAGGHASAKDRGAHLPNPLPTYTPKAGAIGAMNRMKNDIQYGPVNFDAAKEIKNGGLFDRIRANRQPQPQPQTQPPPQPRPVIQSQPIAVPSAGLFPSYQVVDCNAPQFVTDARAQGVTIVSQSIGVEMPSVVPLPIQEPRTENQKPICTSCKPDPRDAVKTGSFLCSNCRQSQVGEWHTEWTEAGQPITFLCAHCWQIMTPQQRETAYRGYIARQTRSMGITGLLYQEISK